MKGTSTNVEPTNVGRYKHKTYKRRTVQTRRTKEEKIYLNFQIKIHVNLQFSLKKYRNIAISPRTVLGNIYIQHRVAKI